MSLRTTRLGREVLAVAALVAALALLLAACDSGGHHGRRSGGVGGGSSVGKDDDHDGYHGGDDDLADEDLTLPDLDDSHDSSDPSSDPSQSPGPADGLGEILPDAAAMAATDFPDQSGPVTDEATLCGDYPATCARVSDEASVAFVGDDDGQAIVFQLLEYDSRAAAGDGLAAAEESFDGDDAYVPARLGTTYGDGSAAYEVTGANAPPAQISLIHQGPYLGVVAFNVAGEDALDDWDLSRRLDEMFDGRMAQAVAGQTPTEKVRAG